MPAAFAAKLVHPDRPVVGAVGDGCFQMTAGELATARRLKLPVPIVVLNDGWLGLIEVKQEGKGYGLSGTRLGDPTPPRLRPNPSAATSESVRLLLAEGYERPVRRRSRARPAQPEPG